MKAASNFFSKIRGKRLAILTHSGCDVDALASAAAFYFTFKKKAKSITIITPDHINMPAKAFAKNLRLKYKTDVKDFSSFDCIVVVDLNSYKMLGSFANSLRKFKGAVLLIDHHTKTKGTVSAKYSIIISDAVSTTEILFDIFKKLRIKIDKKTAFCIAAGMISDSAGFVSADHNTFSKLAEVLKISKKSYLDVVSSFRRRADISEKIAKLKSARRCRIFGSGNYLIVSAVVGAHESDAASALVSIGADVAFAGGSEKDKIVISARANNHFVNKTGFDLAKDVFEELSRQFQGEGGGHAAAAAYSGSGNLVEPLLRKCSVLTHNFMDKKRGKVLPLKEYK